jgi:hypothetical protein
MVINRKEFNRYRGMVVLALTMGERAMYLERGYRG